MTRGGMILLPTPTQINYNKIPLLILPVRSLRIILANTCLLPAIHGKNSELGRLYLKGIMQMDTVKAKKMYPDATFTMRVFWQCKKLQSTDAVHYNYVTTAKGVLENMSRVIMSLIFPPGQLS